MPEEIIVRYKRVELETLSQELNFLHAHLTGEKFQNVRRLEAIRQLKFLVDRELVKERHE